MSNNLLNVITGSFRLYSRKIKTAEYFLISVDLGLVSYESQITAVFKDLSMTSAVIEPPASAKFPKHSAPFSTSSGLFVVS